MERTEHTFTGYMGLRMAEENRLGEYHHGDYESHRPGPRTFIPIDEVGDSRNPFDLFDPFLEEQRKQKIILQCKAFQKSVIRRMFQVASMQELYSLVGEVQDWDDNLPGDVVPSWDYLVKAFDKAEARVRGLVRKTAARLRSAVLQYVRDNPELPVRIGNVRGYLEGFTKQEQYAYAWEVIAGK